MKLPIFLPMPIYVLHGNTRHIINTPTRDVLNVRLSPDYSQNQMDNYVNDVCRLAFG